MKITIYELLGMIKDGKAPKKVKWKNNIYTYVYDDDREENIINYYCDLERHIHLIDGGQHDIRLNDTVEILEEKKIPEKLKLYAPYPECDDTRFEDVEDKINEIINYLSYLKSKGE